MIDPMDKDRVRDASDIVQVVAERVALRPQGREYVGLCPFHDDHKPSMYVVPAKQIFHCFSCGAGGDVFTFLQRFHGMEFPEALEHLAQRAGIELRTDRAAPTERPAAGSPSRRDLLDAAAFARDFYKKMLVREDTGAAARDVIARRGIAPDMVERFELGAAPDMWDGLAQTAARARRSEAAFLQAGLLKRRQDGSPFDMLRNRLVFPIHDQMGRPVAFGGRRIDDDDEPKYLNTPETPLFEKGKILFGLSQATRQIQKTRTAIVCEGYTDVIACHAAGFANAVATLGTALTTHHAQILRRLCDTVVLLFDADEAGLKAADRAAEVFFTQPLDVRVACLDASLGAKDPDELLKREVGPEVFSKAIDAAPDLLAFRYRRIEGGLRDAGPAALQRALEDEVRRLGELGLSRASPLRRSFLLQRLSELTGLGDRQIARLLARTGPRRAARPQAPEPDAAPSRLPGGTLARLSEREVLLAAALHQPATLDRVLHELPGAIDPSHFEHGAVRAVAGAVAALLESDRRPDLHAVLGALEDPAGASAAVDLAQRLERALEGGEETLGRLVDDCVRTLRRREAETAPRTLTERIEAQRQCQLEGGDRRVLPRPALAAAARKPLDSSRRTP